jgi:hypothetical protein
MRTGHPQSSSETPGQKEVCAQGYHEGNALAADEIDQSRSVSIRSIYTELSVTLSYLARRINDRTAMLKTTYFFRTLRNPE